jgi:hypothetical protein
MRVLTFDDVRELLRREVAKSGSQSAWARNAGVRPSEVSVVLTGRKKPNKGVLAGLGLKRVICYQEKVRR